MKKCFAVMVSLLFLFSAAGLSFAQSGKQDVPPTPIEGKKTEKAEKRQQMTPDKQKSYGTPGVATGQAKPDTTPVKKSEKSKKRQAQTPEKKKAVEDDAKAGASGK